MINPCDAGCIARSRCPYGARFFECPTWQEWAFDEEQRAREEDEDDDD